MIGKSSIGHSTPRSPRATITASVAAIIASMFFRASGFSILAITLDVLPRFLIISFNSIISFVSLTKDNPIHSILCFNIKSKSFKSLGVKLGIETLVSGKFTPLLDDKIPP